MKAPATAPVWPWLPTAGLLVPVETERDAQRLQARWGGEVGSPRVVTLEELRDHHRPA